MYRKHHRGETPWQIIPMCRIPSIRETSETEALHVKTSSVEALRKAGLDG